MELLEALGNDPLRRFFVALAPDLHHPAWTQVKWTGFFDDFLSLLQRFVSVLAELHPRHD